MVNAIVGFVIFYIIFFVYIMFRMGRAQKEVFRVIDITGERLKRETKNGKFDDWSDERIKNYVSSEINMVGNSYGKMVWHFWVPVKWFYREVKDGGVTDA